MSDTTDQPGQQSQPGEPTTSEAVYPGGFLPPPRRTDVFTGYTPDPDNIDSDRWPNVLLIEHGDTEDDHNRSVPVVRVETNYKPHGRTTDTFPVNLPYADAIRAAAALLYTVGDGIGRLTDTEDERMPALTITSYLLDLQGVQEALDELREGLLGDLEAGLNEAADAADTAAAAADAREIDERARVESTTTTTEGAPDVDVAE